MAKLYLWQGAFMGKVGDTRGGKWKNKKVIAAQPIPKSVYSFTYRQQDVQQWFSNVNHYLALFMDQAAPYTSWDKSSMSVRNAVVKYNRALVDTSVFNPAELTIARGSLVQPVPQLPQLGEDGKLTVQFTVPDATNITTNAMVCGVAVQPNSAKAEFMAVPLFNNLVKATSMAGEIAFDTPSGANPIICYIWLYDKHNNSKTTSMSISGYLAGGEEPQWQANQPDEYKNVNTNTAGGTNDALQSDSNSDNYVSLVFTDNNATGTQVKTMALGISAYGMTASGTFGNGSAYNATQTSTTVNALSSSGGSIPMLIGNVVYAIEYTAAADSNNSGYYTFVIRSVDGGEAAAEE